MRDMQRMTCAGRLPPSAGRAGKLTRRSTLALPGLLALPAVATGIPDRPLFGTELSVLENGLTVARIPRPDSPVAVQMLWVKAGGTQDPEGRSGTAHFLEHMMFKGTPTLRAGGFSRAIARMGGTDNAFTTLDVTTYHQEVAASDLATAMRMEADRFVNALIPADQVGPEHEVVLEERRQRTDVSPRARFREALTAALWGSHPRGRPVIGSRDDIRAIGREDLVAFHLARYAPGNCVLVVQGGPEETPALITEIWGGVAGRAFVPRQEPPPPAAPAMPRLERREAGISEPSFSRAWIAPSLTTGETRHALPLDVLTGVLGGGPGGRLHRTLIAPGLATSAFAYYDSESAGGSEFVIIASPNRDVEPARLEAAVDALLDELIERGPGEEEVARAIRQATSGALLALDSAQGAARAVGGTLSAGLPLDMAEFWPRKFAAVTTPQVHEAARVVLGSGPVITGWLLPA